MKAPRYVSSLALVLGIGLVGMTNPVRAAGELECYSVPAISNTKRLPHEVSKDAVRGGPLRAVAARGEYEPVSFLIKPLQDIQKLEISQSSLIGAGGHIPADAVDIKYVKVWYQAGTAWYSYFGDATRRELTPELLLKDDSLVKVDYETRENYLRVGDEHRWISYPSSEAKEHFNYLTEPVADSKVLKPINLKKDRIQQVWVTVKVPESVGPGVYRGKIDLTIDGVSVGTLKLAVKVLPFTLPEPRTYYDLDNDFLVTIYGTGILDLCRRFEMDQEAAYELQAKYFENIRAHNVYNCRSDLQVAHQPNRDKAISEIIDEIKLICEAGFKMKPFISRGWAYPVGDSEPYEKYEERMGALIDAMVEEIGHRDIYFASWDEASTKRVLIMRRYAEFLMSKGVKLWATTHKGRHFDLAGHVIGYANHGGWPDQSYADMWHSVGAKVASYAGPHTGPENPDVFRRMEGLARYKARYDGSFNYKLYSQLHPTLYKRNRQNVWNDFKGGAFRGFNMAYPTANGLIDTLAWEGFREGIDDIRYATRLKLLARDVINSTDYKAIMQARKALVWLELLDAKTCDLQAARMEIIEHIAKITEAMEKQS